MARAARLIHESTGPLIVSGIGKSGHIAGKIASTFRSIGKAAIFLHPGEASHGALGSENRLRAPRNPEPHRQEFHDVRTPDQRW